MRIEAVNSYLSTFPIVDFRPVPAVGRHQSEQEQVPEIKPAIARKQVDTMGNIFLPFDNIFTARPIRSKLSSTEFCALEALIASERFRPDRVLHSFPGLLKA